jgi:iron-sulfur cluster repair protein YtfE (RIC family)
MTTTQLQPVRQIRLPGQEAAPEGPIDMIGMFLMHHAFRRDLSAFARAVTATPVADQPTWRALSERWAKFGHVLHAHHTREDTFLWPQVTEKARAAGDAESVVTLEAMHAEHAEIDPLLESVAQGLDHLAVTPDPDLRTALEERMTATRDSLARHLAHEERDALAIAQRLFTAEEWEGMEQGQKESLRELAFLVPWVVHRLPDEAWPRTAAFGGPLMVAIARLFRRRFERQERRAFYYA